MGDKTKIEWTDATWGPVTGCVEVSPGCDHCYAKTFAERFRGVEGHYFEQGFDVQLRPDKLALPLRWTKPRMIFVNSMSDLFHDSVPDEFIAKVFAVMAATPQHTYQLLTKRHGRMRSLLNNPEWRNSVFLRESVLDLSGPSRELPTWPLTNLWLGVSVENQRWADIRIPALLDTPAAVRWLSCEPLLGPIDLGIDNPHKGHDYDDVHGHPHPLVCLTCSTDETEAQYFEREPGGGGIDWVVVGGESGHGARPMHPDWARSLRDQCQSAGVPFLFKQHGEWAPASRDDATHLVQVDGSLVDRANATVDNPYGQGSGLRQDLVDRGHQGWARVRRVGKKAAGREMDGRTWDEYPAVVS